MSCTSSKRVRLSVNSSGLLVNGTYLSLVLSFLRLRTMFKNIIIISKYHYTFLNKSSNVTLVKELISHDFGNIMNAYKMKLPFKKLKNCLFIKKLYTDFKFIQKLFIDSHVNSTVLLFKSVESEIIDTLAPLGKYNCIKYWIDNYEKFHEIKIDLNIDWSLFTRLSKTFNFNSCELNKFLNHIQIPLNLGKESGNINYYFRKAFYGECINSAEEMHLTNGLVAILQKIKQKKCSIVPSYSDLKLIYTTFLLLVFGNIIVPKKIKDEWNWIQLELEEVPYYNELENLKNYFNDNPLKLVNGKRVIKKILERGLKYKKLLVNLITKSNDIKVLKVYIPILNDEDCHNHIKKLILDCF